jgi:hypothetical protein
MQLNTFGANNVVVGSRPDREKIAHENAGALLRLVPWGLRDTQENPTCPQNPRWQ